MSTPDETTISLAAAITELAGASSSLHMDDERDPNWIQDDISFLDEKYKWAKHSMSHIRAALHILDQLRTKEEHKETTELFTEVMAARFEKEKSNEICK